MKVIFNDGTTLDAIQVLGGSKTFQGTMRDALEFVFNPELYSMDLLNTIFSDEEKTVKITLVQEEIIQPQENGEHIKIADEEQFLYHDYCLKTEQRLSPVVIAGESSTNQGQYEERISVSMCQLTYIEKKLKTLGIL